MSLEELDFDPFAEEGKAAEPARAPVPSASLEGLEPLDFDPFDPSANDTTPERIAQNIVEFGKGILPGAVRMAGTTVKGAVGLARGNRVARQESVADLAGRLQGFADLTEPEKNALLNDIRRSRVPADVREEFRRAFRSSRRDGTAYEPSERVHSMLEPSKPITEAPAYKTGQAIEEAGNEIIPAKPGYEESPGRLLGEGGGSMLTGVAASVVGGPVLAAQIFALAGSGEAVERAIKDGATEDQIIAAAQAGVIPGLTDSVPVEVLLGRIPIAGKFIKVPANMLGRVLRRIGRVGLQTFVEGVQEGGQEFLQNLISKEIYKPDQSLTEGILPSAAVGGGVGAIAETGRQLLKGFAGRRGRRALQPGAVSPEIQPGDAESPIPTDLIARGREVLNRAAGIPEGAVPAETIIGEDEDGQPPGAAPTVPTPTETDLGAEPGAADVASPAEALASPASSFPPGGESGLGVAGSTVEEGAGQPAVPDTGTALPPSEPATAARQVPSTGQPSPQGLPSSGRIPSETAAPGEPAPAAQGTFAAGFGSNKQQNRILVGTRNRLRKKLGDRLTIRRQGKQWVMRLKDATPGDTALVQKELARQNQIALDRSERARARGAPRKAGPVGLAEAIARDGGITDPGGELKSRDLDRFHVGRPGMPRLIASHTDTSQQALIGGQTSASTRSPDYRREWAIERGYLPEDATIDDLYEAIAENRAKPEEGAAAAERQADTRQADREAQTRDEIKDQAREMGEPLSEKEVDAVLALAVSEGLDGASAVEQYIEREAINAADDAAEESGDETYADIPFESGPAEAGGAPRSRGEGQPGDVQNEVRGEEVRAPPAQARQPEEGAKPEPVAEPAAPTAPTTEAQKPRPLYVQRPVKNAKAILLWAKSQGFKSTLAPEDMHVTIAYSKEAMDWNAVETDASEIGSAPGGARSVEQLGDKGAVVLKFQNATLQKRWKAYRDAGASWDYESYQPHITITYDKGDVDLAKVRPYNGAIMLGPEVKEDVNENAAEEVKEISPAAAITTEQTYEAARAEHSAAFKKFDEIRDRYRKGMVGDDEFLAAKEEYDAATEKFDAAFAKASKAPIPKTEQTDQGEQAVLPGAERIGSREQAERGMEGRAKPKAPQAGLEGLEIFDPEARAGAQPDIFDQPAAPAAIQGETIGDMQRRMRAEGATNAEVVSATREKVAEEEGKTAPPPAGTQNRLVIETGVVLRTQSGRETSPAPRIDTTSERKTTATLKRMDAWLLEEAKKEAEVQIREGKIGSHVRSMLEGTDVGNMSPADRDNINEILFGKETATAEDVVRVEKPGAKKPAAPAQPAPSSAPSPTPIAGAQDQVTAVHAAADKAGVAWDNDPAFMDFTERLTGKRHLDTMTGAELAKVRQALEAEERPATAEPPKPKAAVKPKPPSTTDRIEDFGEVLEGARKHYAAAYHDRMKEAGELDVASEPLSKTWPEPDYQKLLDDGADQWTISFIHAARDEIPTKPQRSWKLVAWVKSVQALRGFSNNLLDGAITKERLQEELAKPEFATLNRDVGGRAELYRAVGHEKSLKGIRLRNGSYSMLAGKEYDPPKVIWSVEKQAKATAFGNWPRQFATGDTREDAIAAFKKKYDAIDTNPPASKQVKFAIYSRKSFNGFIIGKKVGKEFIDLKKFEKVTDARLYLSDHQEDLEKALERFKNIPQHRKESDAPRVGFDHRDNGDVTPEIFAEEFGFRGVQFGNYVEGPRRQHDLNRAYDALMDMAGVLGIPPKSISLNGELGLAFGARGKGGKRAAAAHFEPDTIVINLTKGQGAGSLAHEWWHGLDNYFARARKQRHAYLSESPYERGEGVRPEMVTAFKEVMQAINQTSLAKRSADLDRRRSKPYWSTGREMAARAFESYIIAKLQDQSASNDYLANIVSEDFWKASAALGVGEGTEEAPSYPYPTAAEVPVVRAGFDKFFTAIESRETDKGVQLYSLSRNAIPPFYSALLKAAEGLKQERGNGLQFLAMLRKAGGVKEEEIAWLGLDDFLKPKRSVTRQEIVDFIAANQVQIEDVTKGAGGALTDDIDQWRTVRTETRRDGTDSLVEMSPPGRSDRDLSIIVAFKPDGEVDYYEAFTGGLPKSNVYHTFTDAVSFLNEQLGVDDSGAKFTTYTLPGGENYREVLLTLPPSIKGAAGLTVDQIAKAMGLPGWTSTLSLEQQAAVNAAWEAQPYGPGKGPAIKPARETFRTSHWAEPNVLAHVRLNDRTDANGKRTLFIEEIQSDWHQKGRKVGYGKKTIYELSFQGDLLGQFDTLEEAEARRKEAFKDGADAEITPREVGTGVPDAPFKKTWHEMAFRRVVRMAAEGGYDSVSWTPGEVQAERYDLSKHLSEIHYSGTNLVAYGMDGETVLRRTGVAQSELPDLIGKEAADRLMAKEPIGTRRELVGLDLKVGGEGMKAFYDKMLVNYANKFGKKFGAHVGETAMTALHPSKGGAAFGGVEESFKAHALPITDAMRETALGKGFQLFNIAGRSPTAGTTSPWLEVNRAEFYDGLRTELDRAGLKNISLAVADKIRTRLDAGQEVPAQGLYEGAKKLITVSMESDDALWVLDHESIHAIRDMGVLTAGEWNTIERAVRNDARRLEEVRDLYADIGLSEDQIVEEAAADMFADWRRGDITPTGFIRRAFEKIRKFIEALGNALRGSGFRSADDVFGAIAGGEAAGRVTGGGGAERQSFAFRRREDAEQEAARQQAETGFGWFTKQHGDGWTATTHFVPVEAFGEQADMLAQDTRERMRGPQGRPQSPRETQQEPATSAAAESKAPKFSLQPHEAETAKGRKTAMGRLLGDGAPLDRAFRLPFDIFGGISETGEWKPGAGLFNGARKIIAEAKFSDEGKFAWLNKSLHVARAGLIDRYGLDPAYVERERRRARDERAIMIEGVEILKTLKDQDVGIEEAKALQAVLTGEAVSDAQWEQIAGPIRQAIDQLGQEAVSLGLLSRESYERNRGTYLHRVYMKHEVEQDGLSRWVGQMMGKNRKKIIGDQFKGRGMFLEVEQGRLLRDQPEFAAGRRGTLVRGESVIVLDHVDETGQLPETGDAIVKPLRRVYWPAEKPIPDRLSGLRNRGAWEVRSVAGNKVTLWRDFTKAERESMGEIMDARYTIGKTFMMMAHDLATGRFYKDISENEDWTRGGTPNTRWVDAAEFSRRWADETIEWVKVPDTAIPDTGGKKRYGALAGKFVRASIWRDINELDIMQRPTLWTKLLTQWKLNKTARSPVVHMNNIMSNFVLMDLADIGMTDFVAGIRAYASNSADYEDAAHHGAFGSDMISQEIRRDILEPMLKELAQETQGGQGAVEGRIGLLGKLADRIWSAVQVADRTMIDLYRVEDEVFRMATYMRRRKLGDSAEVAAAIARDQFLDYDIRAPWVNMARRSVLPFASYVYRAAPVIAKSLAEHPWKLAKYFSIAYALNALAYLLEPGDEDKERRSIREEEQGYTWIGTPRMLRMPYRDAHGNPIFLDIRRYIPAGDIFDIGQGSSAIPFPAPLLFGGPLMLGAELFLNRSAFTGKDIVNERTDDMWDRTSKLGDWAWKSWMPSAAWVPGSWYWSAIGRAATGARDYAGRPYSLPTAVSSSFGVKLKPQDVEQNFANWSREFDRVERDLRFEMRTIGRDHDRGLISPSQYREGMARVTRKFETLGARRQEILDPRR